MPTREKIPWLFAISHLLATCLLLVGNYLCLMHSQSCGSDNCLLFWYPWSGVCSIRIKRSFRCRVNSQGFCFKQKSTKDPKTDSNASSRADWNDGERIQPLHKPADSWELMVIFVMLLSAPFPVISSRTAAGCWITHFVYTVDWEYLCSQQTPWGYQQCVSEEAQCH